jgi:peptide/nickel transport system ATP-binding protein
MSILDVRGLSVNYGSVCAADKVSFSLSPGQILGLVGESGCGKSTVALGMLRLLGAPAHLSAGQVMFQGQDILGMDDETLRALRWKEISVVPQSALSALNPVLSIGEQFRDTLAPHGAEHLAAEAMERVELDPKYLKSYPHQLSGGMRQRVVLALALALSPKLVVMDEPTTALDVVVERQILARVLALQRELGFAMVFVTHDLSLLMDFATDIGVMYAGRLVELGPASSFKAGGRHPYTQGLRKSIPPGLDEDRAPYSIPGAPPRADQPPSGCRFHPRCSLATARCAAEEPPQDHFTVQGQANTARKSVHRASCWELNNAS